LTTHKITLHFSKPNSFQKKVMEAKKQWGLFNSSFMIDC
jgi:hypothetical protein